MISVLKVSKGSPQLHTSSHAPLLQLRTAANPVLMAACMQSGPQWSVLAALLVSKIDTLGGAGRGVITCFTVLQM